MAHACKPAHHFFCMQNVYESDALQHAKGYDYFGRLMHWSCGFRHGFRSTTFAIYIEIEVKTNPFSLVILIEFIPKLIKHTIKVRFQPQNMAFGDKT